MPQLPPDDPNSHRSVLAVLGAKTGLAPKILLPDSDSEHGRSPVVTPGSPASKLVPQGRGNYQLLGEIARGGMGVILKGHDTDLGRDVAVKVLDPELARRPEVVQRFVEEAQIGGQLQHPGIVPVYELGLMADERPYFTMKLVKGHTLASLFKQRKTPTDNRGRLLAIFESVCQTVAYAHSKGVLHRDLKPANVMVGAFGEVQVVDWGLAKVLRRGGVADEKRVQEPVHTVIATVRSGPGSTGSDSMVGSVMGTPAYMAPEQAQGEIDMLDERADVFSLGAILCELLTGRPVYEDLPGETVVSQASRAKLQPARERIEACEADPALVQLCLQCLMPARTARPDHAGDVAKAVHEFLASVEERAQKAELAAEKARIKAEEERRARRLTVALAGAIAGILLLGGGGLWWTNRVRAQRLEETRTVVEAAYGESIELGQTGKHAEALAAARRALSLAEKGQADAALLERTRTFVAKAELEVGAAEREHRLVEQDEKLRTRLVDLRVEQLAVQGNPAHDAALDAAFTQAFHDYGVDLEGDDVVPALKRIRERAIAEDVALTLDDWGRVRRNVQGAKSEKAENLFVLAMDLDPDPVRQRMRQAIVAQDLDAMRALASPENLPKLGPGSISVLAAELWGDGAAERQVVVFRLLERALALFPSDFTLQAVAGSFYQGVASRASVAESQYALGRLTEARTTLRACLAAAPKHPFVNDLLGNLTILLGDYAGGLAYLSSTPEIEADPDMGQDVVVARFYNGVLAREAIELRAERESQHFRLGAYLYALLDHPDPKQRDPAFVLRILAERSVMLANLRWPHTVELVAHIRLEDWSGAAAILDDHFKPPFLSLLTPACYDFVRALVYARAGREDEARPYYQRGMLAWEERIADQAADWEHSDVMRWRSDAEAALPK